MKTKKYSSSTPYDDVFKTLLNDLPNCLIPLVNEMFDLNYTGNEYVDHSNNELHSIVIANKFKRVVDSSFYIVSENDKKHFHIECQSNKDNSMLIRMYEYSTQLAIKDHHTDSYALQVNLPKSGILYLRSDDTIPEKMNIVLNAQDSSLNYEIDVLKIKDYDIETIFNKQLYFLIPFYIFRYDDDIENINKDQYKLSLLKSNFTKLIKLLNNKLEQGNINQLTYITLVEMMKIIVESYTKKYNKVNKEVLDVMGGNVLEYEAKTAYKQGIADGIAQGKKDGMLELINRQLNSGVIDEQTANKYLQEFDIKDKEKK